MLQNQKTEETPESKPFYHLSKTVQCVPGGHQISISEAYWCGTCNWYICYKHLRHGTFTTAKHCPKGHDVTKAT